MRSLAGQRAERQRIYASRLGLAGGLVLERAGDHRGFDELDKVRDESAKWSVRVGSGFPRFFKVRLPLRYPEPVSSCRATGRANPFTSREPCPTP